MKHDITATYPHRTWIWSDHEIEQPQHVKSVVEQLHKIGVKEIRIRFSDSAYRYTDQMVIRAISRASQWAKIRDIKFWVHIDPRQASRLFISKTEERTSFLLQHACFNELKPNFIKVESGHYRLTFDWSHNVPSPNLQEKSLQLDPDCLEKVFLFQMDGDKIREGTVSDITDDAHLQFDMAEQKAHVFGSIRTPSDQDYYVIAYPKFNSNLFDYCGRESNDLLCSFVENLFDGCTHIDGITWGEGGPVEIADPGLLPVSLSIYNSFKAEFGYDLRDRLYCLSLPVDDNSHVKIRNDYYSFHEKMVIETRLDFHGMMHSFFSSVEQGFHLEEPNRMLPSRKVIGDIDPWKKSADCVKTFASTLFKTVSDGFLADLSIIKSLAFCNRPRVSSLTLLNDIKSPDITRHMTELMTLYSILPSPKISTAEKTPDFDESINVIAQHTQLRPPEADTLVVFPLESIESAGADSASLIHRHLSELIAALIKKGVQFDLLSPEIIAFPTYTKEQFIVRHRLYKRIIYPYPQVLPSKIHDTLVDVQNTGFPVFVGGHSAAVTLDGRIISGSLESSFDPADLSTLPPEAIQPMFTVPAGAVATCIRGDNCLYFLLAPIETERPYSGKLAETIDVPESTSLSLYRLDAKGKSSRIL